MAHHAFALGLAGFYRLTLKSYTAVTVFGDTRTEPKAAVTGASGSFQQEQNQALLLLHKDFAHSENEYCRYLPFISRLQSSDSIVRRTSQVAVANI